MAKDPEFDDVPWTERFGREVRKAARQALRSAKRWELSSEVDDAKCDLNRALAKLGAHVEKHFTSGCTVLEAAQPDTGALLDEIRAKRKAIEAMKAQIEELKAKAKKPEPDEDEEA